MLLLAKLLLIFTFVDGRDVLWGSFLPEIAPRTLNGDAPALIASIEDSPGRIVPGADTLIEEYLDLIDVFVVVEVAETLELPSDQQLILHEWTRNGGITVVGFGSFPNASYVNSYLELFDLSLSNTTTSPATFNCTGKPPGFDTLTEISILGENDTLVPTVDVLADVSTAHLLCGNDDGTVVVALPVNDGFVVVLPSILLDDEGQEFLDMLVSWANSESNYEHAEPTPRIDPPGNMWGYLDLSPYIDEYELAFDLTDNFFPDEYRSFGVYYFGRILYAEARGIRYVSPSPIVTSDFLSSIDVFVAIIYYTGHALSTAEQTILYNWVESGGTVLVVVHDRGLEDYVVDSYIQWFGMRVVGTDPESIVTEESAENCITDHPLTDGVSTELKGESMLIDLKESGASVLCNVEHAGEQEMSKAAHAVLLEYENGLIVYFSSFMAGYKRDFTAHQDPYDGAFNDGTFTLNLFRWLSPDITGILHCGNQTVATAQNDGIASYDLQYGLQLQAFRRVEISINGEEDLQYSLVVHEQYDEEVLCECTNCEEPLSCDLIPGNYFVFLTFTSAGDSEIFVGCNIQQDIFRLTGFSTTRHSGSLYDSQHGDFLDAIDDYGADPLPLQGSISYDLLDLLDVFVLPSFGSELSDDEQAGLKQWIEDGGIFLIGVDYFDLEELDALLEIFNMSVSEWDGFSDGNDPIAYCQSDHEIMKGVAEAHWRSFFDNYVLDLGDNVVEFSCTRTEHEQDIFRGIVSVGSGKLIFLEDTLIDGYYQFFAYNIDYENDPYGYDYDIEVFQEEYYFPRKGDRRFINNLLLWLYKGFKSKEFGRESTQPESRDGPTGNVWGTLNGTRQHSEIRQGMEDGERYDGLFFDEVSEFADLVTSLSGEIVPPSDFLTEDFLHDIDALVLSPIEDFAGVPAMEELVNVVKWVKSGGTFILSMTESDEYCFDCAFYMSTFYASWFGVDLGHNEPGDDEILCSGTHPLVEGVGKLEAPDGRGPIVLNKESVESIEMETLCTVGEQTAVALISAGSGHLLILSRDIFIDSNFDKADNRKFMENLVSWVNTEEVEGEDESVSKCDIYSVQHLLPMALIITAI